MSTLLLWLAIIVGLALGVAVLRSLVNQGRTRHRSSSSDTPGSSDLHGSKSNFGNSLQGDNSNFGRGFYDE